MKILKGLKAAMDILLPRECVVCGRRLHLDEERLCLPCWAELPLTHFWERTHNSMADKFNELIEKGADSYMTCGRLERYAYATALFFYDGAGAYRKIPHQLKYHGDLSLGRRFGHMLGQKLKHAEHFTDVDAVIPVPLHWTRKWSRGYNQAEIIASEVAKALDVPIRNDILIRNRRTRTQTKIDPKKKAENVKGAFSAYYDLSENSAYHHILLVDDVFTSGATLHNCFLAMRSILPVSVRISIATLAFVGSA